MTYSKYKWLFLSLILFSCEESVNQLEKKELHQDWNFHQVGEDSWRSAKVPGVVHTDLLKHDLIPDPWVGTNEVDVQWVEEKNWEYKCTFKLTATQLKRSRVDMVFEGLDTYAEVSLNDSVILSSDNMFRTWRVDVKSLLEGENELKIKFMSPIETNSEKLASLGYELPSGNEPVEMKVSPFVRKAPYHFGWDWGPRLVTSGIWRPVYLESWDLARIEDVQVVQKQLSSKEADLEIRLAVESEVEKEAQLQINEMNTTVFVKPGKNKINIPYTIKNPKRWWPNGWGEQHLYDVSVTLKMDDEEIDQDKARVGLRTVELVQEKDSIGESFYFKINGQPLFARGANYIPQSHFLPSVKNEDYERLIAQVKSVGMNMIRVWGGGIYENDYFYDLCDQHGILVWQDFMFACSIYPGDESFVKTVEEEVKDNVRRLRNHPSVVHWNGNNEVEVAWNNWGWQQQFNYTDEDSTAIWEDYLELFHHRIPHLLDQLDDRPYTTTSPLSNWGKLENFNRASMHYWGVWHGKDSFEDYFKYVGRFMSEYGFQSFPSLETISFFADTIDWNLESEVMKHHQKSYIGNGLIEEQATRYFGMPSDFQDFVKKSQQAQALAMQMAIDAHRLKKGHCWGTLFWQLNDCWPGPSWSAIDVFGREKALFQELSSLYAPITIIPQIAGGKLKISLINDTLKDFEGEIQISYYAGEKGIEESTIDVTCIANGIKQVFAEEFVDHTITHVDLVLLKNGEQVVKRSVTLKKT